MLIQLLQTTVGGAIGGKESPVMDFFVQVFVAFLVLPVEGVLRNFMLRSLDSPSRLRRFYKQKIKSGRAAARAIILFKFQKGTHQNLIMDLRALPFCAVLAVFMLLACDKRATDAFAEGNPADPKFDLAHSDPAAVEPADSIMLAMGGRAAWNDIRFVRWQPASARTIFWDKQKAVFVWKYRTTGL